MSRFVFALILSVVLSVVAIVVYYGYYSYTSQFIGDATVKVATEFDFAGYCFGIVAVAIAFAGVYISIVPGGCSAQLLEITYRHLTPSPFGEKDLVKDMVHPESKLHKLTRTEAVKCIHAVIALANWEILESKTRDALLGPEGLSAFRSDFGKRYRFFQNQFDRLLVTILSMAVSIIYVILPFAYFIHNIRLAESMMAVIYYICVIDMFMCLLMYALRHMFVHRYELRMGSWKVELSNFISSKLEQTQDADYSALDAHIKAQVALQMSSLRPGQPAAE